MRSPAASAAGRAGTPPEDGRRRRRRAREIPAGLDVHSFAPLIGATLSLGVRPLTGRGWAPWPSDRQLVDSLVDVVDLVAARYTAAVGLV
ncbi:hypothetical protein, partial [Streptosporangium sp. NPDC003464]